MFEESIKITDDIINKASNDISNFKADFGGTEMFKPIK